MRPRATLMTFVALILAPISIAQEVQNQPPRSTDQTTPRQSQIKLQPGAAVWKRGSDLTQSSIADKSGVIVGRMTDVVMDPSSGRLSYAIVGEATDADSELRAVPWRLVRTDPDALNNVQSIDVERENLKNAPGFSASQWPDFSNRAWSASIYRYYGLNAHSESRLSQTSAAQPDRNAEQSADDSSAQRNSPRWSRLTSLREIPVRNAQNQELGRLSDVVIDPIQGRVLYGVMTRGDKLYSVPWRGFTINPDSRTATLNATNEQFDERFGFNAEHWPSMGDPTWIEETRRRFAMQTGPSPITGTTERP